MTSFNLISVSGVDFTDAKKITVKSRIQEFHSVKSFTAVFPNEAGLHKTDFGINDDVIIKGDLTTNPPTTTVFRGIVEDIDFRSDGVKEEVTLKGRDYSARLQDISIEPTVFNNQEIGSIARKLISDNTTDIGSAQIGSFTVSLNRIVFKHNTIADAITELSKLGAGFWFVDTNRGLDFRPKQILGSESTTLGSANVIDAKIRNSDKDLFNQVWVYGARRLTNFEETFTGDGVGSVFTLQYKPHNTRVTVGGTIKLGGIFEFTTQLVSGIQYLVDFDEQNIIFVSGGSPPLGYSEIPADGAEVVVAFDRDTPIVKFAEDRDSIEDFGQKEKVIQDENITSVSAAVDRVKSTLDRHKNVRQQADLQLQGVFDFTAGKTIAVNLPNQNFSGAAFEILSVDYNFNKVNNLSDRVVKLKVSQTIPDAIDVWKEMAENLKKIQAQSLNVGDAFTRLETAAGSAGFRVNEWFVKSRDIGSTTYILANSGLSYVGMSGVFDHAATGSSALLLGDRRGSLITQVSGGEV